MGYRAVGGDVDPLPTKHDYSRDHSRFESVLLADQITVIGNAMLSIKICKC